MSLEDASGLAVRLEQLGELFTNPNHQQAYQACREVALDSIGENFARGSSPDLGENPGPWAPRQDNKPHPLLVDTGSLRNAATGRGPGHITQWHNDGFTIGIDPVSPGMAAAASGANIGGVPGARRHNYGDSIMPQREFMAISQEAADEMREILMQAIADQAGEVANG